MNEPQPPPFVPFDPRKAIRVYRRNLPHWRQRGATYFVTFRLGDSLPAEMLERLQRQQQSWLKAHGITWDSAGHWHQAFEAVPKEERHQYKKRFNRAIQNYLDSGYGACHLRQSDLRDIAEDSLRHFHQERFWLGDYVFVPNHVHAFMTPLGDEALEDILGSIKGYSARRINRLANRTGESLWQRETYDHIVRDIEELKVLRRYLAENPKKAKLKDGEFTFHREEWMDDWIVEW